MNAKELIEYRAVPRDIHAVRSEVLECLVDGLAFLKSDAAVPAQKLAKRILANIIIEHLNMSGYSIHRQAPRGQEIPEEERVYSTPATIFPASRHCED